jgi:chromate reductase
MKIIAVSGSLRQGSFNTALLRAAQTLHPQAIRIGQIADFPLYDADLEAAGTPAPVVALKQRIAAADGLLLASPEYNNSMPGVLKNAIDWLSRPSGDIRDKPVAVIGASPGGFGTISAQAAWLPVFRALGARHWSGGRLLVSSAGKVFGPEGDLVDSTIRDRLAAFIDGFIAFCSG